MGENRERLEALRERCLQCRECALGQTRKNVVFGVGNPEAEILFVGEGPGANEDEQGEPFVGKAGKLLDDMLAIIGLDRTMVYITNIVKCRPPQNRDPLNVEQDACIAAMRLMNPKFRITKEHGQFYDLGTMRAMALYHPSALLRDPSKRPESFDDLKSLQAEINRICDHTRAELRGIKL